MRGNLPVEAREAVRWMWEALAKEGYVPGRVRLTATREALRQIEAKGYRIETDIDGYICRVEALL